MKLTKGKNKNTFFKKTLYYLGYILFILFIVLYLSIALLNTSIIQSIVATNLSSFFSKQWKTKVDIGAVNINIIEGVSLKNIILLDRNNDTILYADEIAVKMPEKISSKGIYFSSVSLDKTTFNLETSSKGLNFKFIIDYFSSNKPKDTTEKSPFIIGVDKLKLRNVSFSLKLLENEKKYPKDMVAINDMQYKNINADIEDILVIKDSINANIKRFEAKEKSGLHLKKLLGKFSVSPKGIIANNVTLNTENSNLRFDVLMQTNSWKTYSSFIDSVFCQGEIKKGSIAGMKDATYWTESLKGFTQKAKVNLKFEGTLSNLLCDNLEVSINNDDTYIKAKGSIVGLPKPENTIYDITLQRLKTSYKAYKAMSLGDLLGNLPIPSMIDNMKEVDLSARFKGKINNFQAVAQISSAIGSVNIMGKAENNENKTTYSAKIASNDFDAGKLLTLPYIRTTNINIDAKVSGENLDNLLGELLMNLYGFNLIDNNYDELVLNGSIEDKTISAQLNLKDDSSNVNLSGDYSLGEKKTLYADATFSNINPTKLKLFNIADSTTSISGELIADIQDLNFHSLRGNLGLRDLTFKSNNKDPLILKRLNIQTSTKEDSSNSLVIYSDILNATMVGKFFYDELVEDISYITKKYIPSLTFLSKNKEEKEIINDTINTDYKLKSTFSFYANIKDINSILNIFAPNIDISDNTFVSIANSNSRGFKINLNTNKVSIDKSLIFDNVNLSAIIDNQDLKTNLVLRNIFFLDSLYISNINADITTNENKFNLLLKFNDQKDSFATMGNISFNSIISKDNIQGSFNNSFVKILGEQIGIDPNNALAYNGNKLSLLNFALNKDKQRIIINGYASERNEDEIGVEFKNVDIGFFNPLLKGANIELEGNLNKTIKFRSLFKDMMISSDLTIDNLVLNENYLGSCNLNVKNNVSNEDFFIDINMLYKGEDKKQNMPLNISGFIFPKSKTNNMDLTLSLNDFNLSVIERFLESFSSKLSGQISGKDIKIKGMFNNPSIEGELMTKNGEIKIDLINSTYYFSDTIILNNDKFILNNFLLTDQNKNKLNVDGQIRHKQFEDFYIDLIAVADKIKILNTNAHSAQMYYGEAYASARATIFGSPSSLTISVDAQTEKGTKLVIPISSKTSLQNNSFIRFVTNDTINILQDTIQNLDDAIKKSMDLKVAVNLKVTQDAVIDIPMNFSNIGGELKASGEGELNINIDNKGNFDMFGTVNVGSGTFGLNLMSLIEKVFVIEKGGTIQFNGNPTNAYLNLSAVYKTKASLAPVLGSEKYNKPVDVQSIILLTGQMLNPVPKFDIKLPNTDQQTIDELFMYIDRNDEKQMIDQTFNLLVFRQFASSSGGIENSLSSMDLGSQAFDIAFGQLSGALSNMVTFVDVGLNYVQGTEIVGDQVDLNLSKSIGNFDIEFNSVFGGKTQEQASEASNFLGDINVEYKITDNFRIKTFNRSNANDFTKYNVTPYTQGVGLTYKKEYDTFADIFKRKKRTFR
ncbi:MAG: translocation/assembly module TamB domain-containing protein [Bacteroidales bacterium]|jgi:hypothetical protein|nr:translocation/assembly module TamB domain-containing protein [Bacteroidales bacterium]